MPLLDQPVRSRRVAARGTPAAVGHVDRHRVPEYGRLGILGGDVLCRPPHDHAEFHLPVGLAPAVGNHDPVAGPDHGAARRLEIEIGHAAVLAALTDGFLPLPFGRVRGDAAVEVARRVQNLARVHDGREDPDLIDVVDVLRASGTGEPLIGHRLVDDLVQAPLESVLVAADEVEHVRRRRHSRICAVPLEHFVRQFDVDDEGVTQHEPDARNVSDRERPHLERFHEYDPRDILGGDGDRGEEDRNHAKRKGPCGRSSSGRRCSHGSFLSVGDGRPQGTSPSSSSIVAMEGPRSDWSRRAVASVALMTRSRLSAARARSSDSVHPRRDSSANRAG